jgi:hypothetical protein
MRFRLSIFIAATVLFSTVSFGQSADQKYVALTFAVHAYDEAWKKKNVEGVSRILAADYQYFTSDGKLTDKKRTLEFLSSPDYKLEFVERTELAFISMLSRDRRVAILSSRWKGRGTYGKEVNNDDQRCGMVFVMEGATWKLLSEHCVQIVAK